MIDDQLDRIAGLEGALLDAADVHEQVAKLLLRVGDAEERALGSLMTPWSPTWPPDSP
jgi:hypothetical protein